MIGIYTIKSISTFNRSLTMSMLWHAVVPLTMLHAGHLKIHKVTQTV